MKDLGECIIKHYKDGKKSPHHPPCWNFGFVRHINSHAQTLLPGEVFFGPGRVGVAWGAGGGSCKS